MRKQENTFYHSTIVSLVPRQDRRQCPLGVSVAVPLIREHILSFYHCISSTEAGSASVSSWCFCCCSRMRQRTSSSVPLPVSTPYILFHALYIVPYTTHYVSLDMSHYILPCASAQAPSPVACMPYTYALYVCLVCIQTLHTHSPPPHTPHTK